MLGQIKTAVFRSIANNRDSGIVKGLHRLAAFVDSAYRNEGSHFSTNGESRVLERLSGQNFKTVLDVGANVGHWSISALETWKGCHVHAFEIAPETAQAAQLALAAHPQGGRATLHPMGMSDEPGTLQMWYFPGNSELTCASPRHKEHQSIPFQGEVVTLDDFCRQNDISCIDFLKIDVEGSEHKVLKGGSELIFNNNVTCIQFEYGAFSTETRFMLKDYYAMLGKKYSIGKIYPRYVDFREYSWTMEDYKFCNYICIHKSRPELCKALGRD
jgi:FkbM family methyltransferase